MGPPLPRSLSDGDRHAVARAGERRGDACLSGDDLARIAAGDGIDAATAALFEQVWSDPRRAGFLRRVVSGGAARESARESGGGRTGPGGGGPRVVVMPGAFAAEYPHTGADGARVMGLAARLGWAAERVAVPSLGPVAANAAALVRRLGRSPGTPAVVVSVSKGGADVRAALARPAAARELRDVRAWVNLSGIVCGTPLVGWLRARPLRCCGARLLLRVRGQRFAEVDELRHGPGGPLAGPLDVPPGLRAIHVVGFPMRRHLSDRWARRGHARLAPLGPNDGGGILLADAVGLPGDLCPLWGADHYLRPGACDVDDVLLRVLRDAASGPAA